MSRPPTTYPVSLADLINIADAAAELDAMKTFYIDRPDLQKLIAGRVDQLHNIVQRAASHDANLIYAPSDEPVREGAI